MHYPLFSLLQNIFIIIHNIIYSLIVNLLLLFNEVIKEVDYIIPNSYKVIIKEPKLYYVTLKTENKTYFIPNSILFSKYINVFLKAGVIHAII